MNDETQTPSTSDSVEEPVYAPRGEARIPGISAAMVDARLNECAEFFTKHCDEADYRNLDWYLWRMQLRYGVGEDILEVVDDAFLAARCLHDRHAMHLELKPPEMFMTRRITPVELGIISGMPMLTLEFSATYGLPLMMVLGQTAPEDVMGEANLMTSYFRRGFCADYVELTGLSAVIYAGVIAAIGRGFDDEATLGLNTYAKARDSLRGAPPASLLPKLRRYDALNTALACLCAGQYGQIGEILAPVAEAFVSNESRRAGDAFLSPDKMPPPKYFDLSILTILALGALREVIIDLPETGAIAGYRDFLRGLTEMPERRIEMPALDEESRRILREAGIDPDHLGGNGTDPSPADAKAESEARAAALFEERQRRAQEAVKAKIAQGMAEEDSHVHVTPAPLGPEKLRMHDDASPAMPDETSGRENTEDRADDSKRYDRFFDHSDTEDMSIRAHVQEESNLSPQEGRSFSHFFDDLDENAIPKFDDGGEDHPVETRTFSQDFFSEETRHEVGLKMRLDEPEPEVQVKKEIHAAPAQADAPTVEDSSPRRDFTKLFDDSEPAPTQADAPTVEDSSPRRDFTKLFDDSEPAPTLGLRMSLDEDAALPPTSGAEAPVSPDVSRPTLSSLHRDAQAIREAQIRELEAEQARLSAQKAHAHEALKLKLDGTETEVKRPESYQERMARLISEKQAADRERALREREEAARELEELKRQGPKAPVVESLQLAPTVSDDPDERVKKVSPEDLVIKGFAYDDLDMIHENTRVREELEEDFDMHAALAQTQRETAKPSEPPTSSVDDDELHVVIDYGALHGAPSSDAPESKE